MSSGAQQRIKVTITAYIYQPIFALMQAEPFPVMRGRIIVDPPEIDGWVDCLRLADRPRRRFDEVEHRPPSVTEWSTGQPKCSA